MTKCCFRNRYYLTENFLAPWMEYKLKIENKKLKNKPGFTLAELLIAMMVTGIILSAVVSLAYALGSANEATSQMGRKQTQLRSATVRLAELIRHCKLICAISDNDIVIWKADEDRDGRINPGELLYIESGTDKNFIRLLTFSSRSGAAEELWFEDTSFDLEEIGSGSVKNTLKTMANENYLNLVPQCANVQFLFDMPPAYTQFLSISFDLEDSGLTQNYQINASLRARSANLLDFGGQLVTGDDD